MNKIFLKIKDIEINNNNSYNNNLFITFDVDWAIDIVVEYVLELLGSYNVESTFFITHCSKLMSSMQRSEDIECGIHPNFNPLLIGDNRYGNNFTKVLEFYYNQVQSPVSIRSHSVTFNGQFPKLFDSFGLRYNCNSFVPFNSEIILKPWKISNQKIVNVPHYFADDAILSMNKNIREFKRIIPKIIHRKGLKVFDFHPIHIFLNSENMDRYIKSKPYLQNAIKLTKNINTKTYGIKDLLIDVIEEGLKYLSI
jgi:hypothetical protein